MAAPQGRGDGRLSGRRKPFAVDSGTRRARGGAAAAPHWLPGRAGGIICGRAPSARSYRCVRSMMRFRLPSLLLCSLAAAAGCDNVGRAFDPGSGSSGNENSPGIVEIVPVGGSAVDGRPKVRAAYPDGAGWPTTVPIVVEFSESVNQASILPTTPTGVDGRIGLRIAGTTQFLPCQYDLLAGGRLLLMRPVTALTGQASAIYEVVLLADARDVDGVRFSVTGGEKVLTSFQTNQDAAIVDGRILAVFPRDNAADQTREGAYWIVFDRPANTGSVVDANVYLRPAGGDAIAATLDLPLTTVGVGDPRVVSITPDTALAASSRYELVVTADVTFGQAGQLDFRNRTPFARFDTVAPAAPIRVELGNALVDFPNKINRGNLQDVVLRVTTPNDTLAGDRVRARLYGGDRNTTQTGDLVFIEREITLAQAGEQTADLDFSGALGTLASPRLDDGEVTFAALMLRGSQASGYIQHDSDAPPAFDVTPPTLTRAGPPGSTGGTDLYTDLEYVAFYGIASEPIGGASLAVSSSALPLPLWAGGNDGRFLVLPAPVGRRPEPQTYSLLLTDRAGNMAAGSAMGNVLQRGMVTGTLAGELTVEAYDEVTLQPIAGATVVVDPGEPVKPAVGQLSAQTGANGRATFAGLTATSNTVTIVRAGYGLITLYDTRGAFVSLPLRPNGGATANLTGTVEFPPTPGATAVVGATGVADGGALGIRTTNAAPNTIPSTPILPNRPQILTAFAGSFEPMAAPTFVLQACQICGASLLQPTAPNAPVAAGGELAPTLTMSSAVGAIAGLTGPRIEDFGPAVGLDTANLAGGRPRVRVTASVPGFRGQALIGVGWFVGATGAMFEVNANYSPPLQAALRLFGSSFWLVVDAEDTAGRISRTRSVLLDTGSIIAGIGPSPIPQIGAPAGPSAGSPAVTFADVLLPLPVVGLLGVYDVDATDSAGRHWRVLVPDRDDPVGTNAIQFPDLAAANVAGLQTGEWSVRVEARQFTSLTLSTLDDFVLTERFRQEVNYARGLAVPFQVQ